MLPLVLGRIDPGAIVGTVVLVISVLSWLVNLIQGTNSERAARANPQKQPKPRPQSPRSEIEELLQELTVEKRKPKPVQAEQAQRPSNATADRTRSKQKSTSQRPGAPPPYAPSRQPARAVGKPPSPAKLGDAMRSHHLGNRVESAVELEVVEKVQHDLGNRIAAALPPQERPIHPLVKILRDPAGVRQAVLLNEILQRPLSLRR